MNKSLDVNKFIGYAAEGNINYSSETMIIYATSGHIRRKMLSYFSKGKISPLDFTNILMVDEIHSGSLDNTIILSLWMKAASSHITVPRFSNCECHSNSNDYPTKTCDLFHLHSLIYD